MYKNAGSEVIPYPDNKERNNQRTGRSKLTNRVIPHKLLEIQEQWDASVRVYGNSLIEASLINRYLDGEHYSEAQLLALKKAKRVPEKYNIVLRMSLLLEGYFNKTVSTALARAVQPDEMVTALVHNADFEYTQRISSWESTRKAIVKDLICTGLGCANFTVHPTGNKDKMGREINKIRIDHTPSYQVLPDPRAKRHNMDDMAYLHHWEYMSYTECLREFGQDMVTRLELLHAGDSGDQSLDAKTPLDTGIYDQAGESIYWKDGQSFFIVRTYQKDENGDVTLYYWHGDLMLKEVQLPMSKFPLVVIPLMRRRMDRRYYTPLYDILSSQDAINQSLLAFQKLIDSERIIVDKKAVPDKDLADFKNKVKTIGEVLQVNTLAGIKIEYLSNQAQAHINKIYTTIQFILETIGINEAFLGQSKAGDSGRKFEGQRSASENTLDYIFTPINLMYEELLRTHIHMASVYRQATETLRLVDDLNQERWIQINEPFQMPTGEKDPMTGEPIFEPVRDEVYDKEKGEWAITYVNERTGLHDIDVEVEIHTAPYDDTDAIETAFLESILNGMGGQLLAQTQPGAVFYLYSLLTKNLKTRYSERIAMLFSTISQQLGGLNVEDPRLYMQGQMGGQQGMNGGGGGSQSQAGSQGTPQIGQNAGGIANAAGISGDTQPQGYNAPTGGN